jgi:ferrous iron transport protein B
MHLLGLVVAIPVVLILNRGLIKTKKLPFLLELPPYQAPKLRDVWLSMYFRAKTFLQTAGTIIVAMSVVIWALLYFPRSPQDEAVFASELTKIDAQVSQDDLDRHVAARQLETSFLGRFGKAIEPAFAPAGFDWRLTTSILSAFPAREVVVSAMGIIFNLGGDQTEDSGDLRSAMMKAKWPDGRPLLTPWSSVSLMVFFALCCQCMATLATVKRETGTWKWPVFMFTYMTVLAYVLSVAVFQLGKALGQ